VVIVNHNGARYLEACLQALEAQELEGGFEVVVVDNASSDGSLDWLRRQGPRLKLVEAGRNLGFAAGNNLGFRSAGGRHLVMLNSDTRVRPGWLRALVAAVAPGVGAVTSKLVFADRPNVIQNAGLLLLSDGSGGDRGSGEEDRGQYGSREDVFGFCGAAALLTREALEDVGGFDERFFMYYEDLDLSWRLRLRGFRVVYEPEAVVEHVHAAASGEWSDLFTFHADRNRLFAVFRNAGPGFLVRSYLSLVRRTVPGSAANRSGRPPSPRGRIIRSFLAGLPWLAASRARIRSRRKVGDSEIERWLYPRELWDSR
jgi:GT2 family glycosyltransferase